MLVRIAGEDLAQGVPIFVCEKCEKFGCNLHQIANLFSKQKLRFHYDSPKHLEILTQSSRIFEELEFWDGSAD